MIGWLKLVVISGAVVASGVVLWISIMSVTGEKRSVSWYLANPDQRSADYAWCRDHPDGAGSYWSHPGISCEAAIQAKLKSDADAFLRAAAAAAKQR